MSTLLQCRAISKAFPGVQALDKVDFEVREGEVHALVGENGAGKSTLMHILAGVHQPDSGTIELQGSDVRISDERAAQRLGIAIVYQERSIFDLLTVAENLFVDNQPVNRFGVIDQVRMQAAAEDLLRRIDLHVAPDTPAGRLSPADQQMMEIAKALSFDPRLFILDEPTAALTLAETETLFRLVRQMKERGAGIVYISHRLEEIFEIADRVTVLKDGRQQGTLPVENTSPDDLVSRMVGRDLARERIAQAPPVKGVPALEVRNMTSPKLRGVSFTAWPGEILAFAGLAGAGRTELALAVFGAGDDCRGEVLVDGRAVRIRSPRDAMAAGIGYLPEDRKELGLFLEMNIGENIAAARLERFGSWRIRDGEIAEVTRQYMQRLRIPAGSAERPVGKLSGGNQQKVLLARWLLRDPRVLIVDEPTRGIDVQTKSEIYELLRSLAREGRAVIVISSDLPEVLALADRILVMQQGSIAGELSSDDASEEAVMRLAAMAPETLIQ